MEIIKSTYKDVPAILVRTDKLDVKFLPQYGCRMQSVVDRKTGHEFLELDKNEKFLPQTPDGSYIESDVSGCDDMFPTIDPITWKGGVRDGAKYPCHGQVCRMPHEYKEENGGFSTFFHSEELKFDYIKQISEGKNGAVKISYSIVNSADEDFHCMWAAHCMFAAEKDGKAVSSYPLGSDGDIMFDEQCQFGKRWDRIKVTEEALTSAEFSKDANAYKFFFSEPMPEGRCGYYSPSVNKSILLRFDPKKLPYIGVWVNNGNFKGLHNLAMEIATSPYDSPENAIEKGVDFVIPAGETLTFDIEVSVE